MRLHRMVVLATLVLTALSSSLQAQPIGYVLSGTLYGSIGGTPLNGESFSWFLTGETTAAVSSPPLISVPQTGGWLAISGVGSITLTNPFQFVVDPTLGEASFTDSGLVSGITFTDPALVGFDAVTPLSTTFVSFVGAGDVQTDLGTLVLDDFSDLAFQAVLAVDNTPEPVTLALFGAGLAGLGALRRRKA